VVMTFHPASITATNSVAYAALAVIIALFAFALWRQSKGKERTSNGTEECSKLAK
jgi:cell division protein FtsB